MARATLDREPATALTAALALDPHGPLASVRREASRVIRRALVSSATRYEAADALGVSERTLRRLTALLEGR